MPLFQKNLPTTMFSSSWRNKSPRSSLPPIAKRMFLLAFMTEFIVIYPFYVIMFGQRGHVSAASVGALLAIWMVVSVLAEVPTGVIADRFSKKWSLVIGQALQLATFTVWLAAPNFLGYLAGFVLWGAGEAFLSGASQAYLYESLDDAHRKIFGKIYARSSAFTMMAYFAGSLLAFVIGPHYDVLLLASMAVSLIALGITLGLPATRSQVQIEIRPKILSSALRAIRSHPALRQILIGAVIIQGLMSMLGEYLPQYYQQVGTPLHAVPLFIAVGSLAAAGLYWWMHRIETQISRYQPLIAGGFLGLFVVSFWIGTAAAVIGMFVFTRVLRMLSVHNESHIQHHAPNEARATVGSLYSFAAKLVSAGAVSLVGAFAVHNKIIVPVRWSAIIGITAFLLISLHSLISLRKKSHVLEHSPT
ncbi:MAG TPA: MFS transporter [Candidatus Saccharimonadales bacterium]|nr:MFS transporter [Candidatus Saccharimonadales bacterium]